MYTSLKEEVQAWLDSQGITNGRAYGLGKGHRGVEISFNRGSDVTEFLEKYPKLETKFHNGWFTNYGYSRIYVSMTKR